MASVSIVIPLFNTEKYFIQTIESIVNQTFTDWELIIVDDCSSDGSFEIAEQYASQDGRIKLLKTPSNTGSAKIPIDMGIQASSTDWVVGIGCDDFLDPDTIEKLVTRQKQTSADVVYLRLDLFDDATGNHIESTPVSGFDYSQIIEGKDAMMMTIGGWQIGANGALIKRDIFINRSTFNNNKICHMNVDEYDSREILSMARTVAFTNTVYHYRIHSSSICRKISPKLFETIISDRMVADLVGRVFGEDSPQYRKAKTIVMSVVFAKYIQLARYTKALPVEGQKYAIELIRLERARYNLSEIWRFELSIPKKILLTLPRWMAMIPIKAYVALKYRSK